MRNYDYIVPDPKHSALLIIDVQLDLTLKGAIAEISDKIFMLIIAK